MRRRIWTALTVLLGLIGWPPDSVTGEMPVPDETGKTTVAPAPAHAAAGDAWMAIRTNAVSEGTDRIWTVALEKALGRGSVTLQLADRRGQWKRGVCHPNVYNAEAHEVDISGLRLDGDKRPEVILYPCHGGAPMPIRIYKGEKVSKVPGLRIGTYNFTGY
jgi:hypothetical protein